ncbi:MAG: hypothetical protein IIZ75_12340 [Lachnospiraceae bacterium]|nr:hypothetical protein [Lachnospiraceae bacterium]
MSNYCKICNLIEESTGSKKSEANGDYVEKKEAKDGSGKVLESYEASKKMDTSGTVTEYEKSINRDGSSSELKIIKDRSSGEEEISVVKTLTTPEGVTTGYEYTGKPDGSLILDNLSIDDVQAEKNLFEAVLDKLAGKLFNADKTSLVVPDTVTGPAKESFKVTEIGRRALNGLKVDSVTLPDSIVKIDTEAFKDCGITELNITGKVTKKLFAKNALKGNGTGKKGKGLVIRAASKKDQKLMDKLLKKAGAQKAKVKVSE